MSAGNLLRSRSLIVLAVVATVAVALVWQRTGVVGQEPKKDVNPAPVRHAEELSEAATSPAQELAHSSLLSTSWISATEGWVLAAQPCSADTCEAMTVHRLIADQANPN